MAQARPGLQIAVNEILERHGANGKRLSFRQAERRTGLSPATISELAKGNARTPDTLIRFAQGLGEEATRLLLLAGFAEAAEELRVVASAAANAESRPQDELVSAIAAADDRISALLARYDRALCRLPQSHLRALLVMRLQADVELLESLGATIPPVATDHQITNIDAERGEL